MAPLGKIFNILRIIRKNQIENNNMLGKKLT